MNNSSLHLGDNVTGVALEPAPIEILRHRAKLDGEIA